MNNYFSVLVAFSDDHDDEDGEEDFYDVIEYEPEDDDVMVTNSTDFATDDALLTVLKTADGAYDALNPSKKLETLRR